MDITKGLFTQRCVCSLLLVGVICWGLLFGCGALLCLSKNVTQRVMVGGWWLVVGGWWLLVGGYALSFDVVFVVGIHKGVLYKWVLCCVVLS